LKTIRDALLEATQRLEQARLAYGHGTANALDEAAWLVLHAADLPPQDLNGHLEDKLTAGQERAARDLVTKRIRTRKPLAYLLNEAWLGPYRFYVDERVIVPRSFIAEMMLARRGQTGLSIFVFHAEDRKPGLSPTSILDLCTGSGCLAIPPRCGSPMPPSMPDLSDDAPPWRRTCRGLQARQARAPASPDLFSASGGRSYDLHRLEPAVREGRLHAVLPDEYRKEPAMALASGSDGLDHARRILAEARGHLNRRAARGRDRP
jgi:ribosomal protein L3 glutamine methyltransferase